MDICQKTFIDIWSGKISIHKTNWYLCLRNKYIYFIFYFYFYFIYIFIFISYFYFYIYFIFIFIFIFYFLFFISYFYFYFYFLVLAEFITGSNLDLKEIKDEEDLKTKVCLEENPWRPPIPKKEYECPKSLRFFFYFIFLFFIFIFILFIFILFIFILFIFIFLKIASWVLLECWSKQKTSISRYFRNFQYSSHRHFYFRWKSKKILVWEFCCGSFINPFYFYFYFYYLFILFIYYLFIYFYLFNLFFILFFIFFRGQKKEIRWNVLSISFYLLEDFVN